MKKTVSIEGMHCSHCTGAVTKALNALEGVSNVEVSLENNQATLEAADYVTDETISSAIDDQGFDVTGIVSIS